MTMQTDNNISVKEYNKISKYENLEIEIEKMWHFKTTTLPVRSYHWDYPMRLSLKKCGTLKLLPCL